MRFIMALLIGEKIQSESSGRIFDTSELNPKFMGVDAVITNNITTEKERTKSWKIIELKPFTKTKNNDIFKV